MPEVQFTTEELKALVEAGDLTQADIPMLPRASRSAALRALLDAGKLTISGEPVMFGPMKWLGGAGRAGRILTNIPGAIEETLGVAGRAGRILTNIPGAIKETLGEAAGTMAGGAVGHPWIGRILGRGVGRVWKGRSPALAQALDVTDETVRLVKPKLSVAEAAEYLRKEHGSAQAGRMLFGPARPGVKAAERQAAIKRLAPGESRLPAAAKKAIDKELAASTAEEAFAYAAKAPNDRAKEYFGEQLRQALLARLKRN